MGIKLEGFEDIFSTLDDMDISDKKKKKALKSGVEIVRQAVIDNSPVRTGRMKKRWKARIRRIDGDLGFEVKGDTVEDIYNEFGSSGNKKHIGFFSNAVDGVTEKAIKTIAEGVLKWWKKK